VQNSWVVTLLVGLAALGCDQSMRPEPEAHGGATATGSQAGAPAAGTTQSAGAVNGGTANGGTANGGTANGGTANGGTANGGVEFGGSAGNGLLPAVDVSGNWAMFGFEDPVAVSLTQSGTTLSGRGCCAGLATEEPLDCCGPIKGGSIIDRNVEFAFAFDPYLYAADVFVSADGQRMAGRFHGTAAWGSATAWLRIGPADQWLPPPSVPLPAAVRSRVLNSGFDLVLAGTAPVGAFLPSTPYRLNIRTSHEAVLSGDLGAFWEGELTWNDSDETLIAGPVPETDPELPTELHLRFEGRVLIEVVATLPSGDTATFSISL
jgi:hypothetical protein